MGECSVDYLKLLIFVLLGLKRVNWSETRLDAKTAVLWGPNAVGGHILPCECICSYCDASKGRFFIAVFFLKVIKPESRCT